MGGGHACVSRQTQATPLAAWNHAHHFSQPVEVDSSFRSTTATQAVSARLNTTRPAMGGGGGGTWRELCALRPVSRSGFAAWHGGAARARSLRTRQRIKDGHVGGIAFWQDQEAKEDPVYGLESPGVLVDDPAAGWEAGVWAVGCLSRDQAEAVAGRAVRICLQYGAHPKVVLKTTRNI
jgi:hypothetical protein